MGVLTHLGAADITVTKSHHHLIGGMDEKRNRESRGRNQRMEVQTDVSRLCRGLSAWEAMVCTWLPSTALLFLLSLGVASPSNRSTLVPELGANPGSSSWSSAKEGGGSSSALYPGWVMKWWMELSFLDFWMAPRKLWNTLTTWIYTRRTRKDEKIGRWELASRTRKTSGLRKETKPHYKTRMLNNPNHHTPQNSGTRREQVRQTIRTFQRVHSIK